MHGHGGSENGGRKPNRVPVSLRQVFNHRFIKARELDLPALAMEIARSGHFDSEAGSDYLPELDLVPFFGGNAGAPEGYLVCAGGTYGDILKEGDVITAVIEGSAELSLGLSAAARKELLQSARSSPDGTSVDKQTLVDFGRRYGVEQEGAEKLFRNLDVGESSWADAGACCAGLDRELAKALFGQYASTVVVRLWRRSGGGGAYEEVAGVASLLRTRDARHRAEATTPGRCGSVCCEYAGSEVLWGISGRCAQRPKHALGAKLGIGTLLQARRLCLRARGSLEGRRDAMTARRSAAQVQAVPPQQRGPQDLG
jgi:hypothetical protein